MPYFHASALIQKEPRETIGYARRWASDAMQSVYNNGFSVRLASK